MYFVQADIPERKNNGWTVNKDLLNDFVNSGLKTAELINDGDYNNNNDMYNSFAKVAKKHCKQVKVLMVNGKVYLKRHE